MTRHAGPRFSGGEGERPERRLTERQFSQSVERGLAILERFTPERHTQHIREIGEGMGMPRPTAERYVRTLAALGYLEPAGDSAYRLGLRVLDLGMSVLSSTGLYENAHPYLEELRRRSTYTASLAILDGPDVLYVDRVRSLHIGEYLIDLDTRSGSRLPAYCTALGKALLAGLDEADLRPLMSEVNFRKHGPNTITSKRSFWSEIANVRKKRLAVDDEELLEGLVAIAAPVLAEHGKVVAAVGLEAHASMLSLEGIVDARAPQLAATADVISARLGYRRSDELTDEL